MNLHLEKASRDEIQYLKGVGVLGKRAPSCSLLNVKDLVKLLYVFDKRRQAEDLKRAVGDDTAKLAGDDAAIMMTRVAAKNTPRPIVLQAAPKLPVPVTAYPLRAGEIELPRSLGLSLVRRVAREAGVIMASDLEIGTVKHKQPPSQRKRKPAPSPPPPQLLPPPPAAAATVMPVQQNLGLQPNPEMDPAAMIAGLDALLSALSDKPEQSPEERAVAHAAPPPPPPQATVSVSTLPPPEQTHMVVDHAPVASPEPLIDADGFALPQHKRARLAPLSPSHAATNGVGILPAATPAAMGMPPASSSVSTSPSAPFMPLHSGLNGGGLYQSPALSFKRTPSADLSSPTAMAARGVLPSALVIPGGMSPMHPSPSPSSSPSASLYRGLLPSPSPDASAPGEMFRWMGAAANADRTEAH